MLSEKLYNTATRLRIWASDRDVLKSEDMIWLAALLEACGAQAKALEDHAVRRPEFETVVSLADARRRRQAQSVTVTFDPPGAA